MHPRKIQPRGAAAGKRAPAGAGGSRGRGFGSVAVYDTLRREILQLKLAPGTLLDETELSERFGLSRSPVREALVRLSAEGLVTALRNRSSIVAPFDMATLPNYMAAIHLMYRLTARLAAENRTAEQMQAIKDLQVRHGQAADARDFDGMVSLNRDFHVAIADAGGNTFFSHWMRHLLDQGQRLLGKYLHDLDSELPKGTLDEHVALVLAIEARNPGAAERAAARDAEIVVDEMRRRLLDRSVSDFDVSPVRR